MKHQRTKNTQLVQFPFRPEAYKNHHKSQHHEDWTSYQLLSHQKKAAFFKKKEIYGIHNFLDKDSLEFVISRPTVVNDVVGDFFFPSGGRRRKRCVQIDDEGHEVVQTAGGRIIPGDNHELSTIRPRNSAHFCWVVVSVDIQGD
jgi:hypothetical protein